MTRIPPNPREHGAALKGENSWLSSEGDVPARSAGREKVSKKFSVERNRRAEGTESEVSEGSDMDGWVSRDSALGQSVEVDEEYSLTFSDGEMDFSRASLDANLRAMDDSEYHYDADLRSRRGRGVHLSISTPPLVRGRVRRKDHTGRRESTSHHETMPARSRLSMLQEELLSLKSRVDHIDPRSTKVDSHASGVRRKMRKNPEASSYSENGSNGDGYASSSDCTELERIHSRKIQDTQKKEIERQAEEIRTLQARVRELESSAEATLVQCINAKQLAEDYQLKLEAARREAATSETAAMSFRAEVEEARRREERVRKDLERAVEREMELKSKQDETRDVTTTIKAKAFEAASQLSSRLEATSQELYELRNKYQESERSLESFKRSEDRLKELLQEMRTRCEKAEQQATELKERQASYESERMRIVLERERSALEAEARAAEARARAEAAVQEIETEYRKKLATEKGRVRELQSSFEESMKECSTYKERAHVAESRGAALEQMADELTAVIQDFKGNLNRANDDKKSLLKELKQAVSGLSSSEAEVKALSHRNEALVVKNDDLSHEVQRLRSQMRDLESELTETSDALARERRDGSDPYIAQVRELEARMRHASSDIETLNESLQLKERIISDQKSTIDRLRDTLEEKTEELVSERTQAKEREESLAEDLENEKETRRELQRQVERQDDMIAQLEDQYAEVKADLKKRGQTLLEMSNKIEEKQKTISFVEDEVRKVKEMFAEKEKALIASHKAELLVSATELEKLRAESAEMRKRLEERSEEVQSLRLSTKAKDEEIVLANEKVSAVENEMRVLLLEMERQKQASQKQMKLLSAAIAEVQGGFGV
eukprot:Rmarinus@m.14321